MIIIMNIYYNLQITKFVIINRLKLLDTYGEISWILVLDFHRNVPQKIQLITQICIKFGRTIKLHDLRNSEFEYRIYKDSPINTILNRINQMAHIYVSLFNMNLIFHLHQGLSKCLKHTALLFKSLKSFLSSFVLATCPAHLNLLDLIILNILGERCKLWSTLLRNLLYSPYSSIFGPEIRLKYSQPAFLRLCKIPYFT